MLANGPRRQTQVRTGKTPNDTQCSQTASASDTRQNPQMTLSAGKRASESDRRQSQLAKRPHDPQCSQTDSASDSRVNQLAKCPNTTLCSEEKFARVHARRWTYLVLELGSSSRCIFPFHQGKVFVGSQWRAGEKQGGYLKQMVSATPLRPLDTGYRLFADILSRCFDRLLYLGKTPR